MQSLWMLGSCLAFAIMAVFVKLGAAQFEAAELVFYRSVISVVTTAALLVHAGESLRTTKLGMHAHRGVSGFASLFMFFYALSTLPVATAVTLNQSSPVFLALLVAVLTRERPGAKLIASVLLGFVGAVLLLRPVFEGAALLPGLVGLGSGAIASIAYWNTRALVQANEPESRVVFYFALFCTAGALLWMLPRAWTPITSGNVGLLAGVGVMGTLGQIALTRAYGHGSPLTAAALSYSGIVFSSVIAIAVFGERLPWIAWFGVVLIVLAGIMAIERTAPPRAVPPPQITND